MLNLGVVGHRILIEKEKILASIDNALDMIEKCFHPSAINVVSVLAEGADRLVVQQILLRENSQLTAVLPMPEAQYRDEFKIEESENEFTELFQQAGQKIQLSLKDNHDQAYQAAGQYMLDQCDVLILIWDGQKSQGPGGTGEIAKAARERAMPLAWIKAGNRIPGTQTPLTLGEDQGKISYLNFPDQ